MRVPELLIPASSLEVLKTAVIFGADAVYIGGEAFGLRAKAKNFSMEDMKEGIQFAHEHNVRVYVTANILAHNGDLPGVEEYFKELKEIGPDALIISDPGVFMIAKRVCPEIEIHISTQANNTNYGTYRFWHELGAKRVVSARELSMKEIKEIRSNIPDDLEIETFVHGAMCISYSGRCLISQYMTGRDANHGACAQPCRWNYSLMEEKRPGEFFPVEEDSRGTYLYNSKDMCMIEHIPELIKAGIDSFKIEGRNKTAYYTACVTGAYRAAVDAYLADPEHYVMPQFCLDEVNKVSHREYYTGFYFGPSANGQHYGDSQYIRDYEVVGMPVNCREDGTAVFALKNRFFKGEELELLQPGHAPYSFHAEAVNDDGEALDLFNVPQMKVHFQFPFAVDRYAILRKKKERPE